MEGGKGPVAAKRRDSSEVAVVVVLGRTVRRASMAMTGGVESAAGEDVGGRLVAWDCGDWFARAGVVFTRDGLGRLRGRCSAIDERSSRAESWAVVGRLGSVGCVNGVCGWCVFVAAKWVV